MTTLRDPMSEQRVYSAAEIDACLHFVKLSSTVDCWWPCLVFSNAVELRRVTQQLNLWTTLSQRELMLAYMQHLPGSANCRVALLMGQPPAPHSILKFDIATNEQPFIVEPFYDNVLQFGVMYSQNEQYLHAVQQTLPLLQQVTDSLRKSNDQTGMDAPFGIQLQQPKSTTLKMDTRIDDDAISRNEEISAPPVNKASKIASNNRENRKEPPKQATSSPAIRRNSPRQLTPTVSTSTTTAKKKENTNPLSSRPLPSVPPSASIIKTKGSTLHSSRPLVPPSTTNSKKQYESVEIPTFQEVKNALVKGGYKFTAKSCFRPPMVLSGKATAAPQAFPTVSALRHDLCVYGVNCRCGAAMDEETACACWTADEKWYIKLWVRYDVIRAVPGKQPPSVPVLSPHVAQQYLIRLGYHRRLLASPLVTTDQVHDLFRYLSRFGLPSKPTAKGQSDGEEFCDLTQLSSEELLSLEYFISSSRYQVNTFTVIPMDSEDAVPIWSMMQDDTPSATSSATRPKRTATVRTSQPLDRDMSAAKKLKVTRDESTSATIVSVESDVTKTSTSSAVAKKKPPSTALNKKVEFAASNRQSKKTKDESGLISFDSPVSNNDHTGVNASQAESVQKQRVSLSPMLPFRNQDEFPIPKFDGSDHDNLCSCLNALRTAHQSNIPTVCFKNSAKSKFARNIHVVADFLQSLVSSGGKYGGAAKKSSTALYVCGAPGLGKSSGVRWCCDMIAQSSMRVETKVCHVNAAHLTTQSNPLRFLVDEMGKSLGLKAKQPKDSAVLKMLRKSNMEDDGSTKQAVILILVVDEIDSLVTGNGKSTASKECLRKLLEWANSSTLQMGLIGISNCMNDENLSDICDLGKFSHTVIFSPYSEYELKQILLARVGSSIIASNVLDYIAKKVATSSGDARKALELAANAVQHRLDQLTASNCNLHTKTNDGPIVKMPNVIQANKEDAVSLKERIAGQPVVGKVILCVLTSYALAGGAVDTTIGELKQCVSECMRQTGMEDEMVQMDDFLVLLETLVDSGLLRASSNAGIKNDGNGLNLSRRMLSDVHRQPIRLGIQLEDIEKVLESDLQQSFYQNLRARAKRRRHEE